jgi:hypothetical protein
MRLHLIFGAFSRGSERYEGNYGSPGFPVEWAAFWGMSAHTRAHTPKCGSHNGNSKGPEIIVWSGKQDAG